MPRNGCAAAPAPTRMPRRAHPGRHRHPQNPKGTAHLAAGRSREERCTCVGSLGGSSVEPRRPAYRVARSSARDWITTRTAMNSAWAARPASASAQRRDGGEDHEHHVEVAVPADDRPVAGREGQRHADQAGTEDDGDDQAGGREAEQGRRHHRHDPGSELDRAVRRGGSDARGGHHERMFATDARSPTVTWITATVPARDPSSARHPALRAGDVSRRARAPRRRCSPATCCSCPSAGGPRSPDSSCSEDVELEVAAGTAVRLARRDQAGQRARRHSGSRSRAAGPSTSAPRRAGSPTACSSAARRT